MKSIQTILFIFFLALSMLYSPRSLASDYDVLIQDLAGNDEAKRAVARQLLPREGLRAFPDLLNLLEHDEQRVWRTARNVLSDICHTVTAPGYEGERDVVTDQLLGLIRNDIEPHVRVEIIRLLGKVAPEGRDLSALTPFFAPREYRSETIDALVVMSTHSAATFLESQLNAGTTQDKVEIIDALRTIGLRTDYSVPASLLSKKNSAIRIAAMRALASTGNPAYIEPFLKTLGKSTGDDETQALDATLHLANSIMQSGGNWDIGLSLFRTLLNDFDSPSAKGAALAGLGRYGDASVVSEIIDAPRNAEIYDLEAPALMALDDVRGKESYEALLSNYQDAGKEMQLGLLGVMGRKKAPIFLELLIQNAASDDPSRQALAFEALVQSELPEGADVVTAYVESRPVDDRKFDVENLLAYADTMSHKNEDSAAAKAYLSLYRTTANQEFREIAFQGIKRFPSSEAYTIILEYLDLDDLSDVSVETLLALNVMLDADEFPKEVATLRTAMVDAARSAPDVQSVLDMADQQGESTKFAALMGFITRWNYIGPFPWSSGEGFRANPIDAPAVDLATSYIVDDKKMTWKQRDASGHFVDIVALLGQLDGVSMYAYATFQSKSSMDAQLRVGSDDGVRIWLNGKSVHENNDDRGISLDADVVPVKLEQGDNELLVQITQHGGGWGFMVRLTKPDGTPIEQKLVN